MASSSVPSNLVSPSIGTVHTVAIDHPRKIIFAGVSNGPQSGVLLLDEATLNPLPTHLTLPAVYGVAVSQTMLAVSQMSHNRVSLYSITLVDKKIKFTQKWSIGDDDEFRGPAGLAFVGTSLLVVDKDNHRLVDVSLQDGKRLRTIGTKGDGPLQFRRHEAIASGRSPDTVLVADFGGHRIQELRTSETAAEVLGMFGNEESMDRPVGVCAINQTTVAVVSKGRSDVSIWKADSEGAWSCASRMGKKGTGPERLMFPAGIDHHDGWIVIADTANGRVVKWKLV